MAWRATHSPIRLVDALVLRRWVMVVLALLAVQIALGGWTSANYAALACANDFPKCVGQWWPPHDFREGFVLWRGIGVDYEGGILEIGRHTSELQSLMRSSYAVFCLTKKNI